MGFWLSISQFPTFIAIFRVCSRVFSFVHTCISQKKSSHKVSLTEYYQNAYIVVTRKTTPSVRKSPKTVCSHFVHAFSISLITRSGCKIEAGVRRPFCRAQISAPGTMISRKLFTPILVAHFAKNLQNRKTSLARTGNGATFWIFPDKITPAHLLTFAWTSYMPNLSKIARAVSENPSLPRKFCRLFFES